MSELCDRCGNPGQDRRTIILMACFYALNELPIPFGQLAIKGKALQKIKDVDFQLFKDGPTIRTAEFEEPTEDQKEHQWRFHTLRVCKRCRGEWMDSLENWWVAPVQGKDYDADDPALSECVTPGTGLFIRENGVIKEITHDEYQKKYPGNIPLIVKEEDG